MRLWVGLSFPCCTLKVDDVNGEVVENEERTIIIQALCDDK